MEFKTNQLVNYFAHIVREIYYVNSESNENYTKTLQTEFMNLHGMSEDYVETMTVDEAAPAILLMQANIA